MGLDMYAYTTPSMPDCPVDFDVADACRIHYWRKHPNLHGWMEQLYREKGGREDSFNCVNLALTLDDLDALESAIKSGDLPETEGFFYGRSDGTEYEDDLNFVIKAREAILRGETVFYSSWW